MLRNRKKLTMRFSVQRVDVRTMDPRQRNKLGDILSNQHVFILNFYVQVIGGDNQVIPLPPNGMSWWSFNVTTQQRGGKEIDHEWCSVVTYHERELEYMLKTVGRDAIQEVVLSAFKSKL